MNDVNTFPCFSFLGLQGAGQKVTISEFFAKKTTVYALIINVYIILYLIYLDIFDFSINKHIFGHILKGLHTRVTDSIRIGEILSVRQ